MRTDWKNASKSIHESKVRFFSGSVRPKVRVSAVLAPAYTLIFLLTVLPEMGTNPTEDQIKSVMPWSFSLPAYCRQTYSEIQ